MRDPKYGLFVFVPHRKRPRKLSLDIALWHDGSSWSAVKDALRQHQVNHPDKRLAPGEYRVEAFVDNGTPYLRCLCVFRLTVTADGELTLALG